MKRLHNKTLIKPILYSTHQRRNHLHKMSFIVCGCPLYLLLVCQQCYFLSPLSILVSLFILLYPLYSAASLYCQPQSHPRLFFSMELYHSSLIVSMYTQLASLFSSPSHLSPLYSIHCYIVCSNAQNGDSICLKSNHLYIIGPGSIIPLFFFLGVSILHFQLPIVKVSHWLSLMGFHLAAWGDSLGSPRVK